MQVSRQTPPVDSSPSFGRVVFSLQLPETWGTKKSPTYLSYGCGLPRYSISPSLNVGFAGIIRRRVNGWGLGKGYWRFVVLKPGEVNTKWDSNEGRILGGRIESPLVVCIF